MEESKELQGFYKIFRTVVYVSVLLEFFEAKSQRYCLSASLVSERGTRSIWSSTHAGRWCIH